MSNLNKVIAGSIVGASAFVGMTTILNADEVNQGPSTAEKTAIVAKQEVSAAKKAVQIALDNVNKVKATHTANTQMLKDATQKLVAAQENLQNKLVELNKLKQSHKNASEQLDANKQAEKVAQSALEETQQDAKNRETALEEAQQQKKQAEAEISNLQEEKNDLEQLSSDVNREVERLSEHKKEVIEDLKHANEEFAKAQVNLDGAPTEQAVAEANNAKKVLEEQAHVIEQKLNVAGEKANTDLEKANIAREAVEAAEKKLNDLINLSADTDEATKLKPTVTSSIDDIKQAEAELLAARNAYEAADVQAKTSVRDADELQFSAREAFNALEKASRKFYEISDIKEQAEAELNDAKLRQNDIQEYLKELTEREQQLKLEKERVTNDLSALSKELDQAVERSVALNQRVKSLSDEEASQQRVDEAVKNADAAKSTRMKSESTLTDISLALEKAQSDVVTSQKTLQDAKNAVNDAQVKVDASKLALEKAQAELTDAQKAQTDDRKMSETEAKTTEKEQKNGVAEHGDVSSWNKDVKQTSDKTVHSEVKTKTTTVNNGNSDLPKTESVSQDGLSILGALLAGLTVWGFGFKKRG